MNILNELRKLANRRASDDQPDVLVLDHHDLANFEFQPLPARLAKKAQQAEAAALERCAPVAEHDRRIEQAAASAIAALPPGLRSVVEQCFADLAEAEATLLDKRRRLADLPSDGGEVWIQRRAQLTTAIEALEDLVKTRTQACVRICRYTVPGPLDQALATRVVAADQAIADAEAHHADLLARSKAEISRLKKERDAAATIRAQAHDPIWIERHVGGRQISADPPSANELHTAWLTSVRNGAAMLTKGS